MTRKLVSSRVPVNAVWALGIVLVAIALAIAWWPFGAKDKSPHSSYVESPNAAAIWKSRTSQALTDLNQVPAIPGVRSRPASLHFCAVDSGQLFDASAGRLWTLAAPPGGGDAQTKHIPELGKGFVTVSSSLQEQLGWVETKRSVQTQTLTPFNRDYDSVLLQKRFSSGVVDLQLQVSPGGISANLTFPAAPRVCRHA